MATPHRLGIALIALMLSVGGMSATPAPGAPGARAAPPELVNELRPLVEHARQRFEARDATGVLAHVSEQYRSGGMRARASSDGRRSGSCPNSPTETSRATPRSFPSARAAINASSSMISPRATFTRVAPGFIAAKASRPISLVVSGVH